MKIEKKGGVIGGVVGALSSAFSALASMPTTEKVAIGVVAGAGVALVIHSLWKKK